MARKLKVYRTPIGFHDAYVAAASQKDALAAWGSDANLFARGVAEPVTDPALTKEPLANPGKVIKRLRGSAAEHFEALPKAKAKPSKPARTAPAKPKAKPKARKPASRPSRKKLDAAEQALMDADGQHASAERELRAREEALQRERRAFDRREAAARAKLKGAVARARRTHDAALAKWRDAD